MFKLLLVTFATLIAAYDACDLYETGVTDSDRQIIVSKHNELRQKITNGEVEGQPKGVNLKTLVWDETLASKAQNTANDCSYYRFDVGENLKINVCAMIADWDSMIQTWFDENSSFTYPQYNSYSRHYTQIVWADTEYIGCGFASYREPNHVVDPYREHYICYYGPAGNVANTAPYETA